jgi:hypothetical protein
MEALARLLTRERVLVELLVFKLVELKGLLLAGETRFLGWASEEVDRATEAVRMAELERGILVADLAGTRGLEDITLSGLVADAPEPWAGILRHDQEAMTRFAGEIADLLLVTRRLAEAGARSIAESLGNVPAQAATPYHAQHSVQSRIQRVL